MIGKVTRGSDVGGLLRYLFGPGRHNEHVDPHLIAGWPKDLLDRVEQAAPGRFDLSMLTAEMRLPAQLAQIPEARSVWHCSLRAAPEDPRLSDDRWATVAADVMRRTGLDVGDGEGVRWVAVRHAEDHIHIAAVLARPDGTVAEPRNDYYRVAEACHAAERLYGLRSTAPSDRTAGRQPTRAEVEKATRAGLDEPPRVTLRREVRAAAAVARDPDSFIEELQDRGLLVRLRHSQQRPDEITGFAVALPGDRADGSRPAWFGGSKLAPELSWRRLQTRWADQPPDTVCEPEGWAGLSAELEQLDVEADCSDEVLSIAAAAAMARMRGVGSADRSRVDDDIARACRRAWGASRTVQHRHRRLLSAAQSLPRASRRDPDVLRTVLALARLLDALARVRQAQTRAAQADAALRAAAAAQRIAAVGGPAAHVVATRTAPQRTAGIVRSPR